MTTQLLNASNPDHIALAAELLRAGELVAIPTETVYGLAANALDENAVAKIFAAKGRPQDNPLIVHVYDAAQARSLVKAWPFTAQLLAEAFWPGPLTLILPRADHVPGIVSAGLSTLALRVPAHPAAQALLRAAGIPLAAPSANRSGSPSPTLTSHVLYDLDGKIAAVLDGGPCIVGVESTVLDLTSKTPLLLRPGGTSVERLEAVLDCEIAVSPAVAHALANDAPTPSPGMKYRHYAPRAELTLVHGALQEFIELAKREQPDGLLCFDDDAEAIRNSEFGIRNYLCYGSQGNSDEQARQLFARLREIDALDWRTALVRCPSKDGLGLAVYNRLLRAASFREVNSPPGRGGAQHRGGCAEHLFLGLTGPTGAGKSTAARILESLGCAVIDGDALAREIVQPGSPVLQKLAERFGADICKGQTLDRQLLAERAFASEKARQDLNSITHPAITQLALSRAKALQGARAVVLDAAALLESELAALCAHILVITAPEDLRLARILARGGVTEEAARRRLEAQRAMDWSGAGCTVIENTGSEEALRHAVEKAFHAVVGSPGAAPGGAAGGAAAPEA